MSLIVPGYIQRDPDYYFTDFSEYAAGGQPSDWTKRWVTTGYTALVQSVAGSLSGQALRWTKTAASRQLLSWDKLPAAADFEVLVRSRAIETPSTPEALLRIMGRASGAAGAETGYLTVHYYHTSGTNLWRGAAQRYLSGTGTQIDSTTDGPAPNFAVNNWFWSRFNVKGSTISRKQWWHGQAEPGSWTSQATDTNISAGGWIGLYNVEANPDVEIDFFAVALGGKTVPLVER